MSSGNKLTATIVLVLLSSCSRVDSPTAPAASPSPSPSATPANRVAPCSNPAISKLIGSPSDGAVLRGVEELSLNVAEINCAISARTCLTISDSEGRVLSFRCHDIGTERFDTTQYPNGNYTFFAQPACHTSIQCPNGHRIGVRIRN